MALDCGMPKNKILAKKKEKDLDAFRAYLRLQDDDLVQAAFIRAENRGNKEEMKIARTEGERRNINLTSFLAFRN